MTDAPRPASERALADFVAAHALRMPGRPAYLGAGAPMSWADYDARSRRLACLLVSLGFARGERIAVLLPDGPGVHAVFLANERAGLITMGIGSRAGVREIEHLIRVSGAVGLISRARHQEREVAELVRALRAGGVPLRHHLIVAGELATDEPIGIDGRPAAEPEPARGVLAGRALGPDEVFLLNSTSGTTGMPKVVTHDQRRWLFFHQLALRSAALEESDVFMSVVSAPFGFGIWTSHVTPTLLGAPTVVMPRFDADAALDLIERHHVSVLAAVSTQFILMLEALDTRRRELGSLRVLFTGGEAVPYARAAAFEDRTGAAVLQFYGSNETGAVSGTALSDTREQRLRSAGRAVPEMQVRLFDESGKDVTSSGRGQPGCKGPTLSRGYWNDPEANSRLIRPDGWMLLGDIVEIDAAGYLRVVGRTDDFIIRGGKNISGPAVEQDVATHPSVALAAAVAMPDPVFGERVCVFVELRPGHALTLDALVAHLSARGVSKESFPERLELVHELPRGSGGKVAKQELREQIARKLEAERGERVAR